VRRALRENRAGEQPPAPRPQPQASLQAAAAGRRIGGADRGLRGLGGFDQDLVRLAVQGVRQRR
jgi:hypothetical protein